MASLAVPLRYRRRRCFRAGSNAGKRCFLRSCEPLGLCAGADARGVAKAVHLTPGTGELLRVQASPSPSYKYFIRKARFWPTIWITGTG